MLHERIAHAQNPERRQLADGVRDGADEPFLLHHKLTAVCRVGDARLVLWVVRQRSRRRRTGEAQRGEHDESQHPMLESVAATCPFFFWNVFFVAVSTFDPIWGHRIHLDVAPTYESFSPRNRSSSPRQPPQTCGLSERELIAHTCSPSQRRRAGVSVLLTWVPFLLLSLSLSISLSLSLSLFSLSLSLS